MLGILKVVREDIEIINRLAQDFALEIAELDSKISNLELSNAFLEDHQFSTTTKLEGEVIFGLASVLTGSKDSRTTGLVSQNYWSKSKKSGMTPDFFNYEENFG